MQERVARFALKWTIGSGSASLAISAVSSSSSTGVSYRTLLVWVAKDRTNVMVSLIPTSGTAHVGACAVSVDNRSGFATTHLLAPAGGLPTTPRALAAPIETQVRKRPVKR